MAQWNYDEFEVGKLVQVDPATGAMTGEPIALPAGTPDVGVGEGAIWIASPGFNEDGKLFRIDPP